MLRNPVYCGKIVIPRYKEEEEYIVDGLHEPLTSETTFYRVQDFLDGKKRTDGTKIVSLDMLPLRGFLICPKCGRKLTGSASKGCRAYYYYYHCSTACKIRFRADEANKLFDKDMNKIFIRDGYEAFYFECIIKAFRLKSNKWRIQSPAGYRANQNTQRKSGAGKGFIYGWQLYQC